MRILAQELVAARWLNGEQPYDYLNLYMRWLDERRTRRADQLEPGVKRRVAVRTRGLTL